MTDPRAAAGDLRGPLLTAAGPLLDALRGMRWPARQPLVHGAPGAHRSRRRGPAVEFTEYRPYRQGDDPRRLDWKLLARTDRAYVRITDDHALVPTTIVVDASASMAFPRASVAKWRTAQLVALGLAVVAHQDGDPVAVAIAAADGMIRCPLSTRGGLLADVAGALDRTAPTGSAALAPVLAQCTGSARGRVVIVSDFLGDATSTLNAVRLSLAAGAEAYAVHIAAHEEVELPDRTCVFRDPEDSSVRRLFTGAARAGYLANFATWRATLRQAWLAAGASYLFATTDELPGRIVRRILRSTPWEPSIQSL